jgi:hypothetical protein
MKIPLQVFIDPVIYRPDEHYAPRKRVVTDLARLCRQARVLLRATVPSRRVVVYTGRRQVRTPSADYVGVPVKELNGREAALRALEALAHSFHDHAARACICGRGLFCPPTAAPRRRRTRET